MQSRRKHAWTENVDEFVDVPVGASRVCCSGDIHASATDSYLRVLVQRLVTPILLAIDNHSGLRKLSADMVRTLSSQKSRSFSNFLVSEVSLAKIFVYSMSLDGSIRGENGVSNGGFLAGSRALDSLDKLITSTESFFHPSNSGHWTLSVSCFLLRVLLELSSQI